MRAQWSVRTLAVVLAAAGAVLAGGAQTWPMYQADAAHSGYVPLALDPSDFSLRWARTVGPGNALNPVTAAAGKVFVSIYSYFQEGPSLLALDAATGDTLWWKDFGSVFSVNPPSYGYGNVYIQTGNHSDDTYLRAYDADSGALVFRSAHAAQWERYYAPTIYQGNVYVDGGYYGGMYSFDAFDGRRNWFRGLPQYDQWTPAVDQDYAYAYLGEYSPGLYVVDRFTGELAYTIPDDNFDWNGWSMNLAPTLGQADDAIAIHDGRLISFDLRQRDIRWEQQRDFSGQPSLAQGVIYAIDAGALVALDELSGALLWSWEAPAERLADTLIVTDTHLFARSGTNVYAVDLATHQQVWSYPAAGHLALGQGVLYIAADDGTLTAISVPEPAPLALLALGAALLRRRRS